MSLTDAARGILTALQSGSHELAGQPIEELRLRLSLPFVDHAIDDNDARSAASVLSDARAVAHAHRSHLLHSLQQISRESLYLEPVSASSSAWTVEG